MINEPTSLMDIFHVIAFVTGVPLPTDRVYDGYDILPLLKGDTKISPHKFMFHYCGNRIHAARYRPETGKFVETMPLVQQRNFFIFPFTLLIYISINFVKSK